MKVILSKRMYMKSFLGFLKENHTLDTKLYIQFVAIMFDNNYSMSYDRRVN